MPTDSRNEKQMLLSKLRSYDELPRTPHKKIHEANSSVLFGLRKHVLVGAQVGHFLSCLLANNFVQTVGRADGDVVQVLPSLSTYLNCYPDARSWGDEELVSEWRSHDGYLGLHGPEEAWERLKSDPL